MVHTDGSGEEVTLPSDSTAANRDVAQLTGELSPRGTFHGRYVHIATGDQQYGLRRTFAAQFGATERERIRRAAVNMLFPGATGDSLELFDGRDLRAEPRIAVVVRDAQATSTSGSNDILTLPIHNYGEIKGLAAELEARGPRRFPIDVAAVAGPHEEAAELTLTLPEGWRAQLPPNVTAQGAVGNNRGENGPPGRGRGVARTPLVAQRMEPPLRPGHVGKQAAAQRNRDRRPRIERVGEILFDPTRGPGFPPPCPPRPPPHPRRPKPEPQHRPGAPPHPPLLCERERTLGPH